MAGKSGIMRGSLFLECSAESAVSIVRGLSCNHPASIIALFIICSGCRLLQINCQANQTIFKAQTSMSEDIKRLIICPVTLEFMRDPVMIIQSGQTCDREPLCGWLLEHPSTCPVTGQNFGKKLEYKDNIVARQLVMHFVGDWAYQKYDDSEFQRKYAALWKETQIPDEQTIHLPASTLGICFSGTPPIITKVRNNSPLLGDVLIGMAIDTLVMPGGPTHMEFSANELEKLLQSTSDTDGRVMNLKNPATTTMSKKPDEVEVLLPPGKLGVFFAGETGRVVRFREDSPVRDIIPMGLVVDTLTLGDGTSYTGLSGKEVVEILGNNSESSGRALLLKNPATRTLSERRVTLPDKKIVTIPGGYLGVSFAGEKATITSLNDDSPVKSKFRVGMVVDLLTLPDGSMYSGLSAAELINALRGSSILEGRQVRLMNPNTMKLSSKLVEPKSPAAGDLIIDAGLFYSGDKGMIIANISSNKPDVTAPSSYYDDDVVATSGEDTWC